MMTTKTARVTLLALAILAAGCEFRANIATKGSACEPAPATHEMQCPYSESVPVRFDDGKICDPGGGEIDDRDAGCLFFKIASFPEGGTDGPETTTDPCALNSDLPQCKEGIEP